MCNFLNVYAPRKKRQCAIVNSKQRICRGKQHNNTKYNMQRKVHVS